MKLMLGIASVVYAAVYGALIYVQAATASIGPSYQPLIGCIRWLNPSLLLVAGVVLVYSLARRGLLAWRAPTALAGASLVVALLMWPLLRYVDSNQGSRVVNSSSGEALSATLHEALLNPHLSNRSYMVLFWTTLSATAVLAATLWFQRTRPSRSPVSIAQ
jgi:hypothetical protein